MGPHPHALTRAGRCPRAYQEENVATPRAISRGRLKIAHGLVTFCSGYARARRREGVCAWGWGPTRVRNAGSRCARSRAARTLGHRLQSPRRRRASWSGGASRAFEPSVDTRSVTTRAVSHRTRPHACGRVRGYALEVKLLTARVVRTASGAPSVVAPRRGSDRRVRAERVVCSFDCRMGATDYTSLQIQPLDASQYQSTPLLMSRPCGSGSVFASWILAACLPSLGFSL